MGRVKETCSGCKFCDRYYIRGVKKFNKINFGWCCQNHKTVDVHENCKKFECKTKSVKSKRLLRYYLSDILTEISEIRRMIEEEKDV